MAGNDNRRPIPVERLLFHPRTIPIRHYGEERTLQRGGRQFPGYLFVQCNFYIYFPVLITVFSRPGLAHAAFGLWRAGGGRVNMGKNGRFFMSLKHRLLLLCALFFTLAGLGGAAVMVLNARAAVRAEMLSALELAAALAQQSDAVSAARINALGLRHIHARADGESDGAPAPRADAAPEWFAALIGVTAMELRIVRAAAAAPALTLVAQPQDELAEVWEDMTDLAQLALGLAVLTMAALALAVDRALRPLVQFENGLGRMTAGDYAFRPTAAGPPELIRLGRGIAALADALSAAQAENRRLGRRLVGAQDDERRELARELHDELGATLFGMKVDAGRVIHLAADNGEAVACARRIIDGAERLHHLGRSVMTRLRPPLLDQFPLSEALAELVEGARRQQPDIQWELELDGGLDQAERGDATALTLYRLAQEGLTNARRHGAPGRVTLRVASDAAAGWLRLTVQDDGRGLNGPVTPGMGLAGMAERVQALGGRLEILPRPGGGTELRATLPIGPAPAKTKQPNTKQAEAA